MAESPAVPLTLEGSWALHQMFRWRPQWRGVSCEERRALLHPVSCLLAGDEEHSAVYSMLGHKADLLFLHFRDSLAAVHSIERELVALPVFEYLDPATSYVSVVELGLYESSGKTYSQLQERGLEPHTPEWNAQVAEVTARQATAMAPRLFPAIPPAQYICFYPMDRKRGEDKNWYLVPMAERQRMMHEHGMVGRRYADSVRQIITGSIGFDDWEWGVDLFADDPLVFKKLIYEMRFDEVSAVYALFGTFYIGERVPTAKLTDFLLEFHAAGIPASR